MLAQWPLASVAIGGFVLGGVAALWLIVRIGRALARRPQSTVGIVRYLLALVVAALGLGASIAAIGLAAALTSYAALTAKTHVAEVQCIELEPQKLRLYYVPILADGTRGDAETYDLAGDEWTVGGDVLRFQPWLTLLQVDTVYKITRVEGRWLAAADAKTHAATAFDRDGGTTNAWLLLYRHGARGPLHYLVAGAHGQAVSQLPDRRAVYDLYMTPAGLVVDKRSL